MSSCWRYAGKRARRSLYGSTAWVSAPRKSAFHTPSRPISSGMFSAGGACRKCSSIARKPAEELAEAGVADRDRQRQADGRVDRVAPADPVPEADHVGGVDAEAGDRLGVGGDGDEVLRHRVLAERVDDPAPGVPGVRERLERRERLGDDDDERGGGVGAGERVADVVAVHVRHEVERDLRRGVVGDGADGHRRAQVRAADPDVDDGADALPGRAGPRPGADAPRRSPPPGRAPRGRPAPRRGRPPRSPRRAGPAGRCGAPRAPR